MVKRLRLWTGLVLFVYVTSHLLNHALGLISLQSQEDGRLIFLAIWRNPVGTVLVGGSMLTHLALAFWSFYSRRTLRMHPWEAIQMGLGFAIPYFLIDHIIATRVVAELYGTNDTYTLINWVYWIAATDKGIQQAIVLIVAWLHGCIGLYYWLRLKPWFRPAAPYLLITAILVPTFALLGVNQSGREVMEMAKNPVLFKQVIAQFKLPNEAQIQEARSIIELWEYIFFGLIALVFVGRAGRFLMQRMRGVIRITYPEGRVVDALPGMTVLEASRMAGVPHASVCGGRGRCSTCRVRVGVGGDELDAPEPDEQRVLTRVGAPPNVRLACQIRPSESLEVTPLLPPNATPREAYRSSPDLQGREQEIAILFADIRAFTNFSESKLPYDVVFVLNRYFDSMGRAIEEGGGHLDKFIGDGVMALFGLQGSPAEGSMDALRAARNMSVRLAELNKTLANDLEEPLRIGIGIHLGPAIVGEMGFGTATSLTAIGDSVNTASRLEGMTKEYGAQLIVSESVEARAGLDLGQYQQETVSVRGRVEALGVRVIQDASQLEVPDRRVSRTRQRETAA